MALTIAQQSSVCDYTCTYALIATSCPTHSLSHTHTCTHVHARTHTHTITHTLTHTLCLSLSHTHTRTLARSLSLTHTQTLTRTHTQPTTTPRLRLGYTNLCHTHTHTTHARALTHTQSADDYPAAALGIYQLMPQLLAYLSECPLLTGGIRAV